MCTVWSDLQSRKLQLGREMKSSGGKRKSKRFFPRCCLYVLWHTSLIDGQVTNKPKSEECSIRNVLTWQSVIHYFRRLFFFFFSNFCVARYEKIREKKTEKVDFRNWSMDRKEIMQSLFLRYTQFKVQHHVESLRKEKKKTNNAIM